MSDPEQYLGRRLNVSLSGEGRVSAMALHDRLEGVDLRRVISSPLKRAMETARILAPRAVVEADERLTEADYGDWEGHTRDDIRARWPELRASWEGDPSVVGPPGGESGAAVAHRVMEFVLSLVEWEDGLGQPSQDRLVLVVGHSTVNRVLLASQLDSPLRDYRRRFRQDWTNLSVLRFMPGDGPLLLLDNDVSHIKGTRGITWN